MTIEHDPDLGTSTGTEMYPWMVTVFYNGQSDCLGDDFGDRVPAGIVDHQMLVDNRQLVFENLEVQLNLTQLICPETVGALQSEKENLNFFKFYIIFIAFQARMLQAKVKDTGRIIYKLCSKNFRVGYRRNMLSMGQKKLDGPKSVLIYSIMIKCLQRSKLCNFMAFRQNILGSGQLIHLSYVFI